VTSMLWHSNAPTTLTGYGVQTSLFSPKIRDLGYEVTLNVPMSMTMCPITWDGMVMLGAAGDPLGNDLLPSRAQRYDITLTLCDLFGLFPCSAQLAGRKLIHWMPVDTCPMGERDIATLRATQGIPVAMSRFGYEQIRREGFDPLYVPHGVRTDVFRPCEDPAARRAYREARGIGPETYVIGLAAVNKPDSRKGLDQQMQAFAIFHARHPDSVLFMHTFPKGGWDLEKIALNLGIHNAVVYPDAYTILGQMMPSEGVAEWYQCLDLLTACSEAEGFGLPIVEAQSAGVPVVTTDFSAMTELCSSGWTVPGQRHWLGGHESWWCTPNVEAIAARYEEAFANRDNRDYADRARAFALDFDVDLITVNHWKPVLAECEARFDAVHP
jgi:glycosyltransferase involved in cell wall biosynthesis